MRWRRMHRYIHYNSYPSLSLSLSLLLPPCLLTEIVMINDCIFAFCPLRPPVLFLPSLSPSHGHHSGPLLSPSLKLLEATVPINAYACNHRRSTSRQLASLSSSLSSLLLSSPHLARLLLRNHFSEATFHSAPTAFAINVTFSSIESC